MLVLSRLSVLCTTLQDVCLLIATIVFKYLHDDQNAERMIGKYKTLQTNV